VVVSSVQVFGWQPASKKGPTSHRRTGRGLQPPQLRKFSGKTLVIRAKALGIKYLLIKIFIYLFTYFMHWLKYVFIYWVRLLQHDQTVHLETFEWLCCRSLAAWHLLQFAPTFAPIHIRRENAYALWIACCSHVVEFQLRTSWSQSKRCLRRKKVQIQDQEKSSSSRSSRNCLKVKRSTRRKVNNW